MEGGRDCPAGGQKPLQREAGPAESQRVLRTFELGPLDMAEPPSGLQGKREGFISPWGHMQVLLSQRL